MNIIIISILFIIITILSIIVFKTKGLLILIITIPLYIMYINSKQDTDMHGLLKFIVYAPNYIFFIISIPYFLSSWNKEKITDKIKLKKFATYCLIVSFFWCIYPILSLLWIFTKQSNTFTIIGMYIVTFSLCASMLISGRYRLSCYYINFILQGNGEKCCNMFGSFMRIIFLRAKIPELNFVDFNSAFIYHSIATAGDFVSDANIDIDFSRDSILQNK